MAFIGINPPYRLRNINSRKKYSWASQERSYSSPMNSQDDQKFFFLEFYKGINIPRYTGIHIPFRIYIPGPLQEYVFLARNVYSCLGIFLGIFIPSQEYLFLDRNIYSQYSQLGIFIPDKYQEYLFLVFLPRNIYSRLVIVIL